MLIFTLNQKWLEKPDIETFSAILKLICANRKKMFDDEFFNGRTPAPKRVLEFIEAYLPYFWLFLDDNSRKTLGFCYFYDIVPAKTHIHTATATICFDKSALGKPALTGAKALLDIAFNRLRIYKMKAECYFDTPYIQNFLVRLGFSLEAILKNETIVDSTPKNIEIWSIFNSNPLF